MLLFHFWLIPSRLLDLSIVRINPLFEFAFGAKSGLARVGPAVKGLKSLELLIWLCWVLTWVRGCCVESARSCSDCKGNPPLISSAVLTATTSVWIRGGFKVFWTCAFLDRNGVIFSLFCFRSGFGFLTLVLIGFWFGLGGLSFSGLGWDWVVLVLGWVGMCVRSWHLILDPGLLEPSL